MEDFHIEADFMTSSARLEQCPPPSLPEYAFVGRSNVGKSSLINMITGRKELAKTSSKPGKTQLINHFEVKKAGSKSAEWLLVDLPGYGYAKVSKSRKSEFQKLIYPYLKKRENLMCCFLLIDSRLPPQKIDLDFMNWLGLNQIPFSMIFTKSDKLKSDQAEKKLIAYNNELKATWEFLPPQFITSSKNLQGRNEILDFIYETNQLFINPIS